MEAGLIKKSYRQWVLDCLINSWFYPYHFVRHILSATSLCPRTVLSVSNGTSGQVTSSLPHLPTDQCAVSVLIIAEMARACGSRNIETNVRPSRALNPQSLYWQSSTLTTRPTHLTSDFLYSCLSSCLSGCLLIGLSTITTIALNRCTEKEVDLSSVALMDNLLLFRRISWIL